MLDRLHEPRRRRSHVRYQVATVGGVWLPEMHDLYDHSGSGDDYAGNGARIDRFRACYGRAI